MGITKLFGARLSYNFIGKLQNNLVLFYHIFFWKSQNNLVLVCCVILLEKSQNNLALCHIIVLANNKIILLSWVNNKMSEHIYVQHFTNARY